MLPERSGFAMARKDNKTEYSQLNILSAITADDIINTDNVLDIIMTAKKEKLLSQMHPYKITEPKSENGRWQTYYKDADGERKILRALSLICFWNGWNTRKQLPTALTRLSGTNSTIGVILKSHNCILCQSVR